MPANDRTRDSKVSGVSRRRFVKAAGASGITVGLAGCTGGGNGGGDGGGDGGSGGGGSGGGGGATDTPISTEEPEEEVTIQLLADANFEGASDQIDQTLRENGGLPDTVQIDWLAGSFESGNRQSQFQQLLSAGEGEPTIMMMDNGWTIPFIARNQLQNLSASLPESLISDVQDKYLDNMLATASNQDGDLFGIPLFADFPTIQYRKDILREAGYSDSDFDTWATEPMKWTEFSQVVSDGLGVSGMEQGFNWQGAAYIGLACCDFVEFMGSWGGSYFGAFENLFGPIGDRPITVEEEQVINTLRMMRTFIHGQDDEFALEGYQQISPDAVVQYTEEPSREPFTQGRTVALRNWPYSININGTEENFGEDLGAMPVPFEVSAEDSPYGPEIGGSTSALGGWHLCLNPNSSDAKKQAAAQVFRALNNDQVRLDLFEIGGWIPPIPDLINTSETRELDVIGRYVDTIQVAAQNAVPRPVTAIWPQQETQVSKEVNATIRQQKSPEDAMASLAQSLEALEQQGS